MVGFSRRILSWLRGRKEAYTGHLRGRLRALLQAVSSQKGMIRGGIYLAMHRNDYPNAYEFLGKLPGREERGRKLAAYFRKELEKLHSDSAGIPDDKLYPRQGSERLIAETRDFFKLFMRKKLGASEIRVLLNMDRNPSNRTASVK